LANYDFTVPDFNGVSGWDSNWGPKTGISTTIIVSGAGFTGPGFFGANPVDGATFVTATSTSTVTP
jgi:hypothetical protein